MRYCAFIVNIEVSYNMNIEDMLVGFEQLSNFGITLSIEKRLLVYNSLVVLKADAHLNKMYLWGIIRGISSDYYVAYGYEHDPLTMRVFYYSLNGLDWLLLPEPKTKDIQYAGLCSARFQGDPKFATQLDFDDPFITDIERQPPPDPDNLALLEHAEQEETDLIKDEGKIKEEDRLAATIFLINEEAVVIPRGAFFMHPTGEVVDNRAFEGLTLMEGDEMRSYLHYRPAQQHWNTNILTRHDYNYGIDFLDTIDSDKPSGLWVMRLYDGNKTIFLHHLSWPGYYFCHIMQTPFHFSFYDGYGKKNLDIPFML